jgi:hypothetical protein
MRLLILAFLTAMIIYSCDEIQQAPQSASGVTKATTKIQTDLNGRTIEQNNIINRLSEDNKPGSIKHLYIISAYSGQVLIYSTVKGKVTSSGKRLTPINVDGSSGISPDNNDDKQWHDNRITIGGNNFITNEVLQDDGTYGTSVEYIYWWDSKGVYHQQYITGGMILHISNQPISVKSITLNFEETK